MSELNVDKWIYKHYKHAGMFYPTIVAKETGLPIEKVFERLLFLSKIG